MRWSFRGLGVSLCALALLVSSSEIAWAAETAGGPINYLRWGAVPNYLVSHFAEATYRKTGRCPQFTGREGTIRT